MKEVPGKNYQENIDKIGHLRISYMSTLLSKKFLDFALQSTNGCLPKQQLLPLPTAP